MDEMAEKPAASIPVELRITQRRAGRSGEGSGVRSRSRNWSNVCREPARRISVGSAVTEAGAARREAMVGRHGRAPRPSATTCCQVRRAAFAWTGEACVTVETDMTDIGTRQLHDHRADRGRDDGRSARQGGGAARRFELPGLLRLRRSMGCEQLRPPVFTPPAVEAAAKRWRRSSASTQARPSSRTALSAARQSQHAAGRGAPARQGISVAQDRMEYGDLRQALPAIHVRRAFWSRWAWNRLPPREIRVRRMLAVCAAGRILNPNRRAQKPGHRRDDDGRGPALMEELAVDKRLGFFVNHDLADYQGHRACRHPAPGGDVPRGDRSELFAAMKKPRRASASSAICGASARRSPTPILPRRRSREHYPITLDSSSRSHRKPAEFSVASTTLKSDQSVHRQPVRCSTE